MRLTVAVDRWDAARGGAERLLADLAGELARGGTGVRVLCRSGSGSRPGVEVEELRLPPFPPSLAERAFARAIARRADGGPLLAPRPLPLATHVQLHGGLLADAFAAEREAMPSTLRRALFPLGNALNGRRRLLLATERSVLGSPGRPALMVWSEALRRRLAEVHGVPPEAVAVVRPGVDLSLFSPRDGEGPPSGGLALLFAAVNPGLKGLATALAALSLLVGDGVDARLTVVGPERENPWRRRAFRLGVAGRVRFLGRVRREALPALYRTHHALVHPTFHDPFSLVGLEALACGCPVVTTRRNGVAELIGEGTSGLVLDDPADAAGLATRIGEATREGRWLSMRPAAKELGRRFPLEAHVREVAAWLGP